MHRDPYLHILPLKKHAILLEYALESQLDISLKLRPLLEHLKV